MVGVIPPGMQGALYQGRHAAVVTDHQAWQDYKFAAQVETLAWELPVTVAAVALGMDLPHVYLVAAAGTERAWQRYRAVVSG